MSNYLEKFFITIMSLQVFEIRPRQRICDVMSVTAVTEMNDSLLKLITERCLVVKKTINEIVLRLNFWNFDEIKIVYEPHCSTVPFCRVLNNRNAEIHVPYLFLLKFEDIPSQFKDAKSGVAGDKMEELFHWTHDFLKQERESFNFVNKFAFGYFCKVLENSEKFEKGKEFLLGHEISHFALGHVNAHYLGMKRVFIKVGLVVLTFFYFRTKIKNVPLRYTFYALLLLKIAYVCYQAKKQIDKTIRLETAADSYYTQHSATAKEGAHYFFTTLMKFQRELRRMSFIYRFFFDSYGNDRFRKFTHGSERERLQLINK